jgi:hypothetical protein
MLYNMLIVRENLSNTKLNGPAGLIFGLNVITFIPILYMNYYLNVNTDTFKGLNFAGVQNGVALMLLVWVLFFTMLHEDEEQILSTASALMNTIINSAGGEGDSDGTAASSATMENVQDSEF